MTPVLPALALAACVLLAGAGVALVRVTGLEGRFPTGEGVAAESRSARGSIVGRWYRSLAARMEAPMTALLGPDRVAARQRVLDAAGRPDNLTAREFVGRQGAFGVLGTTAGALYLFDGNWALFVMLTVAGAVWPDIWITAAARRRQRRIERDLPDFLDVLGVTVSAGMGFRQALERVTAAADGPLAEEMTTTLRRLALGATRRRAFEQLRERNDSDALSEFVTAVLQAEELGAPLSSTIRELGTDLRTQFEQDARARAARAAPRISLVVATTIVPGAVVLIVAALFTASDIDLSIFGG